MATRTELFDTTINSGGGTESGTDDVETDDSVSIQLDGDGNSIDLIVTIRGRTYSGDSFSQIHQENQDLTTYSNNSFSIPVDVKNEDEVKVEVKNNAGSDSDVKTVLKKGGED